MIASRSLKTSRLKLSEIGLCCASLALDAKPQATREAKQMLAEAQRSGITYFDTAPFYGRGLSERIVGDELRRKDTLVISSKVGRMLIPNTNVSTHMPFDVSYDYSYDGVMSSVELSLQRLGLSKIDILLCHDIGRYTHGDKDAEQFSAFIDGGGYQAMEQLRSAGIVKAIGLGVNEIEICQRAMLYGKFDLFLLKGCYSLLDRTRALDFFARCERDGTDIILGEPFSYGWLFGDKKFDYAAMSAPMAKRHAALQNYCRSQKVDIGAAALQFPLLNPLVKSVIPGPKCRQELTQILDWSKTSIAESFWQGLSNLDA